MNGYKMGIMWHTSKEEGLEILASFSLLMQKSDKEFIQDLNSFISNLILDEKRLDQSIFYTDNVKASLISKQLKLRLIKVCFMKSYEHPKFKEGKFYKIHQVGLRKACVNWICDNLKYDQVHRLRSVEGAENLDPLIIDDSFHLYFDFVESFRYEVTKRAFQFYKKNKYIPNEEEFSRIFEKVLDEAVVYWLENISIVSTRVQLRIKDDYVWKDFFGINESDENRFKYNLRDGKVSTGVTNLKGLIKIVGTVKAEMLITLRKERGFRVLRIDRSGKVNYVVARDVNGELRTHEILTLLLERYAKGISTIDFESLGFPKSGGEIKKKEAMKISTTYMKGIKKFLKSDMSGHSKIKSLSRLTITSELSYHGEAYIFNYPRYSVMLPFPVISITLC